MRVTILGGGGFRVPLICRELAASGLAIGFRAMWMALSRVFRRFFVPYHANAS